MSRQEVRNQIATFITGVSEINQFFTSFPKNADWKKNSSVTDVAKVIAVVFIAAENEERLAIGGATNGVKRIDYDCGIQVYHHSTKLRDAEDAMVDFDNVIDNIKNKLRSDHRLGDTSTPAIIWQAAEPSIQVQYGEPINTAGGTIDTWAEIRFQVTQMLDA